MSPLWQAHTVIGSHNWFHLLYCNYNTAKPTSTDAVAKDYQLIIHVIYLLTGLGLGFGLVCGSGIMRLHRFEALGWFSSSSFGAGWIAGVTRSSSRSPISSSFGAGRITGVTRSSSWSPISLLFRIGWIAGVWMRFSSSSPGGSDRAEPSLPHGSEFVNIITKVARGEVLTLFFIGSIFTYLFGTTIIRLILYHR